MSARSLRREVERLKRDTGWQEAYESRVEAAERRQQTRFGVIEYELLLHKLAPGMKNIGQDCSSVTADYERARTWLIQEDTAEQWRADHALLVAREIERYGRERDVARRGGWGADRAEMIEHYIVLWERYILPKVGAEHRRRKQHDQWLAAPDGRGVMSENAWQEKHRARLDREFATEEPTTSSPMFEDWRAEAERERASQISGQDKMSA